MPPANSFSASPAYLSIGRAWLPEITRLVAAKARTAP
jgi:hypothetical protein